MERLFDTREVPVADRVDYWRSAMIDSLAADCTIEPTNLPGFDARMRAMPCGPVGLIGMQGSPFLIERHGKGREGWVSLIFQVEGHGVVRDSHRRAQLTPGDACIVPPDRSIVVERLTDFQQIVLNVPASQLSEVLGGWSELAACRLDGQRPQVRAASDLARFAVTHRPSLDETAREQLGATMLYLLAGIGQGGTGAPGAGGPSSRMATFHRQRIERHVQEHLRDSSLSVASIAAALGLSRRYVHRLFQDHGTTVMQWVLEQRLLACRREIASRGGRAVSDVAFAWGFNSASHFSRAFRKQFGVRPSDL